MAVGAPLLTKATVTLMGRIAGRTVFQIHSSAEHILERGTVPPAWREKLEKRLEGLRPGCTDAGLSAAHRARARRDCLRQLDGLIGHFKKTSIVVDEEARHILVSGLVHVFDAWEAADWDRMISGAVQDPALPDA
jgi:hypothetical protein